MIGYSKALRVSPLTIEAITDTSIRLSPCASAFASRSDVQNASYSFLNLSKISLTEDVQYISYVSGRMSAKTFSGVKPYPARNSWSFNASATSAESTIICEPILWAILPFERNVPERVMFCGVCQP